MLDGETAPPATEAADASFDQALDQALSTEAPATGAPAPAVEPAAAPEKAPAAAPRDGQGRFTAKPAADELAPVTEPAKAPETTAEPTAEAEAQPEVEAEPTAEAAPELTYRYESDEVGIPGSAVGADGGFIPTQQLPEVLELVALGRSAREGTIRQRLSEAGEQVSRQKQFTEAARAEALHVISAIDEMIEKGTFGDWLQNQAENWAILKADARVKSKEAESAALQEKLTAFEKQEERTRLEPQIRSALENVIGHYGQKHGLNPEAMQRLFERLNSPRFRNQIVVQAQADDPVRGIKRGEWMVEYGIVEDEVQWFAKNGGSKAPADRAAQLQAENERRTGKPSTAPPVATAKRGPAPAAKPAIPAFKSAEEADEEIFDKGGYAKL